jgi:hypothetical protein
MSGGERRGEAAALPGWIAEGNQLDALLLPLEPGPGSHGLDRRRRLAALSDLVGFSRSADRASWREVNLDSPLAGGGPAHTESIGGATA